MKNKKNEMLQHAYNGELKPNGQNYTSMQKQCNEANFTGIPCPLTTEAPYYTSVSQTETGTSRTSIQGASQ